MMPKTSKKFWTEKEKTSLSIGHQLGASIKTLSLVLDRSECALNKAISRLGLRQWGETTRGKRSVNEKINVMMPDDLRRQLDRYFEFNPVAINSVPKRAKASISSKKHLFQEIKKKPKKSSQPLNSWMDLDFTIDLLKRKGCNITRYKPTNYKMSGLDVCFLVDGIPFTAAQLLIKANSLRLEEGLEPFYVTSITEH